RIPATKVEASKTKTARTLEVKAEARPTESVDLPAFAQPPTTNPRQGGGHQHAARSQPAAPTSTAAAADSGGGDQCSRPSAEHSSDGGKRSEAVEAEARLPGEDEFSQEVTDVVTSTSGPPEKCEVEQRVQSSDRAVHARPQDRGGGQVKGKSGGVKDVVDCGGKKGGGAEAVVTSGDQELCVGVNADVGCDVKSGGADVVAGSGGADAVVGDGVEKSGDVEEVGVGGAEVVGGRDGKSSGTEEVVGGGAEAIAGGAAEDVVGSNADAVGDGGEVRADSDEEKGGSTDAVGGRSKEKSGDSDPHARHVLGKRRRSTTTRTAARRSAASGHPSSDVVMRQDVDSSPGQSTTPRAAAATTEMEDETGQGDQSVEVAADSAPRPETTATPVVPVPPRGVQRMPLLVSGGRTTSRRRRAEGALAIATGILATEFREQHQERAKVLRTMVKRLVDGLHGDGGPERIDERRQAVQTVVAVVRKAERRRPKLKKGASTTAPAGRNGGHRQRAAPMGEDVWLRHVQAYEEGAPQGLDEEGSLAAMRALRRRATKESKKFRVARRVRRLQRQQQMYEQLEEKGKTKMRHKQPQMRASYHYERRGGYGDVELIDDGKGKSVRKAQLRAASSGEPTSLPTALLTVSKARMLEIRLDTCAQFSVAGIELRKYGRCLTREAPVDVVEGFGGGQVRVLGVWRFVGTTVYQQRIAVDALLVEGQGSEMLIGEDWMAEHQVKLDFGKRELKYHDDHGQKVILPFVCHGVTPLMQASGKCQATSTWMM
ncbi:hypothetical protein PF004_g25224, partial [Phytophthora fragariae]